MGGLKNSMDRSCIGILSDVGNVRDINEDYVSYYIDDKFSIYIVADGMGGHNAGDLASRLAVEACIDYLKSLKKFTSLEEDLENSIAYANKIIYEKSKSNNNLNGMGTTITACLLKKGEAYIGNVGDSSCYIIKDNQIKKITKDHSLVQELIDDGSITEEQALKHPNKNIITRALGTKESVKTDIFRLKFASKTKFILCTDGLTNEVSKKEMYDIIKNNSNDDSCRLLVELCKNKGGRDNISVIVFEGE